jgi:hypothetical protein
MVQRIFGSAKSMFVTLCAIPAWEGPGDGCKGMRVGGEGVDAALGVGGLATLESDLTGC